MRPASIIYLERAVLLSMAMSLVSTVLTWDHIMEGMSPELRDADAAMGFIFAILFALFLLLLWLVSRKRSNIAKWIFVLVYGFTVVMAPFDPAPALYWGPVPAALTIGQYLCMAAALWLLFRPDARRWFRREDDVDPDIFS